MTVFLIMVLVQVMTLSVFLPWATWMWAGTPIRPLRHCTLCINHFILKFTSSNLNHNLFTLTSCQRHSFYLALSFNSLHWRLQKDPFTRPILRLLIPNQSFQVAPFHYLWNTSTEKAYPFTCCCSCYCFKQLIRI